MSIVAISRKLRGPCTHFLSRLLYTTARPRLPSCLVDGHLLGSSFCQAFHRTPLMVNVLSLHSPACKPFSTRIVGDPFEIIRIGVNADGNFIRILVESIREAANCDGEQAAMEFMDGGGIDPDEELMRSVVWELRDDWKPAVLGFKWGERRGKVDDGARELLVWILGAHGKFNTAWMLIREWHRSSVHTRQPMLVMIDRYAAANIPEKAIWTFNLMEKFRLSPDDEAYHFLLSALCKHGFIDEAEEFMLLNKKLFPLDTYGFNIILNGWCNICVDIVEAKRIWKEMSSYCITPDAVSYRLMISCFSKVGNLFDSLRLCDGMKKRGWDPGLEVYNSLIYVLTRENCFEEALKILGKVKADGLQPDSDTYNSMIRPLCETGKMEEAGDMLAKMIEENIAPTEETYHAFICCSDLKTTLEILHRMRTNGSGPSRDTFLLILSKLFKQDKPDQALRIWEEMKGFEVVPDTAHYKVMVEGLMKCGFTSRAKEVFSEMRSNGFPAEPKFQKLLIQPLRDKNDKRKQRGEQSSREPHADRKAERKGKRLNRTKRKTQSSMNRFSSTAKQKLRNDKNLVHVKRA